MQRDGPRAAHMIAESRIGGLQGVVPIAMTVGGEPRPRDATFVDDRESAFDMLPDCGALTRIGSLGIEEWDRSVEDGGIARGGEVLSERDERPEHDVAVRVARADPTLTLEEHEPLRPVAVGILIGHDAKHDVAQRLSASQREQHLDRSLTDIARAPTAARVLLEAARREVMDERILRVPRDHF